MLGVALIFCTGIVLGYMTDRRFKNSVFATSVRIRIESPVIGTPQTKLRASRAARFSAGVSSQNKL